MRDALIRLLQLAWFMAPAYCANMAAPFVRYWTGWNRPINEAWFGAHKTVLGFAAGVLAALVATAVIQWVDAPFSLVRHGHWIVLGLCFGIGAMGGDALKSLVKRRAGIPAGASWMPFDQIDFVIGALLMTAWSVDLHALDVLAILALTFAADVAVNRLAFHLGVKDSPW
jgi:CDP-2,3-bis-(O-geranylgeranyl)-sn-glycerol synthase